MKDDIDEVLNINENVDSNSKNDNKNEILIKEEEPQEKPPENKSEPNLSKDNERKEKSDEDFKKEIKDYIAHSGNNPEYLKLIETDPQSLFESIDEKKLSDWIKILTAKSPLTPQLKNKDKEILEISLDNIRGKYPVINNDSNRTRVRECVIYPGFLDCLKKVLIYYHEKYNVIYKQGLNEIFGPLILMKYKIPNITLTDIINLGALMIDAFLPNYYYEKEIYSLKCGLGLFLILFKYHEPTVFNRLDIREVNPEVYATNWLINNISGKLTLINFFYLWDEIIKLEDPLFIQFMLVAIIKDKRELIIKCEENYLPILLTSLTFNSKDELKKIINIAKELRKQTPYSFRLLANKIGFLKKRNIDIKNAYEKYKPEMLPAMPIFPSEVLYITYKSQINCINPNCKKYMNDFEIEDDPIKFRASNTVRIKEKKGPGRLSKNIPKLDSKLESQEKCEKCDWGIMKTMQYILLDLRILEYSEEESDLDKTGFLPSMISVLPEELKSDDFSEIITNRFISERGNYHFIFLTTSTDTFSDFESNYYKEAISEEEKRKMRFGLIEQQKISKELDIDNAKKNLSLKEIYKLKEYDNMRITLQNMIKHNFPYVGYVYGGFNFVHEEIKKFNLELINHNEETCILCNLDKNKNKQEEPNNNNNNIDIQKSELYKSLWKHKKKVNYKNLDVFLNNPSNKLHLCVLKEYKKKDIDYGDVQILIHLLFDKFDIDIYKFDNMKQYRDFENTLIIANKKQKEKYYDYGQKNDNLIKGLELTLLEKVFVLDMLSINIDPKLNNVVSCQIRGEKKKPGFLGLFKKKNDDDDEFETLTIVFDFSSGGEAKEFILSFKEMMTKYRQFLKKKNK